MLHTLAKANGIDIETVNLYIGGCKLVTHWENVENDAALYDLECNGGEGERKISIKEALGLEDWDVITLQQASAQSQTFSTYTPYLEKLAEYVRTNCPKAKIWFHQTWAYENDYFKDNPRENNSKQKEMYQNILKASKQASEAILAPLIRAGVAIQAVRDNVAEFSYKDGGMSLNRDGFHLSRDYGRFIAAYAWVYELTGIWCENVPFENFDRDLVEKITKAIKDALK